MQIKAQRDRDGLYVREIERTLWTHVLEKKGPVGVVDKGAAKLLLAVGVLATEPVIDAVDDAGAANDGQLRVQDVVAEDGPDAGVVVPLLLDVVEAREVCRGLG